MASEDPYINGEMGMQYTKGVQEGPDSRYLKVVVTLKVRGGGGLVVDAQPATRRAARFISALSFDFWSCHWKKKFNARPAPRCVPLSAHDQLHAALHASHRSPVAHPSHPLPYPLPCRNSTGTPTR